MLNFIIGRKGSNRSEYIYSLLGEQVEKGDKAAFLIIPKQFTFESDKGILNFMGPLKASRIEVLSFSRLADTVFKLCGGIGEPILRKGANAAMMSFALDSLSDKLQVYSRHKKSTAFVQKALLEVENLKRASVSEEEFFEAVQKMPQGLLKNKAQELSLIYSAYNAQVRDSFFDDSDVLTRVYELALDSDLFYDSVVAFDGFSSFSGQEMKIIELIMKRAGQVYFSLCTDDVNSKNQLSPFEYVNKCARRILNVAAKNSVEIGEIVNLSNDGEGAYYASPAIAFLERNLYNPLAPSFEGKSEDITVCTAPTLRHECDFVALSIHRLLREEGYRCGDIAVVYRQGEKYQKELCHSLKKYGVPVFEDKRAPIQNEPLIVFTRTLFEIAAKGISTERVLCLFKTGLSPLSTDEGSEIENYALLWSIDGNAWCDTWLDNPDGFGCEMNESRRERLDLLNDNRSRLIAPLVSLREETKNCDGYDAIKAVFRFLIENGVDESLKEYAIELENQGELELAIEQEQVWNVLVEIFDEMAAVFKSRSASLLNLCEIFDLIVSTKSLGNLPDGYDRVCICESNRIQTKNVKAVFVLGANSGAFPLIPSSNGIFSFQEVKALNMLMPFFKDDERDKAVFERFQVYSSLCCGSERLFLSYCLSDSIGEKLSESEIVTAVKKLFPLCKKLSFPFEGVTQMLEGEKAAFELMAKNYRQTTSAQETLRHYFDGKSEYEGKMKALKRENEKQDFAFENPENAKELFGKGIVLSASKLETYGECPFKYFCRYGMNAKPRKIAKLDPAESGTVVHYVLQNLLSNHGGQKIFSLSRLDAEKEIKTLLNQYIETYMGGTKGKTQRFLYLYERMYKILCSIADRLIFEFSQCDFVPCDFELSISNGGAVEPISVPLDYGTIELIGVIDRVDILKGEGQTYVRVIDYKTGKKEFSLSDVMGGLGMQMLLYLISIWKNGKGKYENVLPGGVLYYPARLDSVKVQRNDEEEKIQTELLKSGRTNGMLLDDPDMIKSMDKSLSGIILPIKNDSKKGICGNFISLSQLQRLSEKMNGIMKSMGDSLHEGKIPARPVVGKNHDKTCEYCDFHSICRREQDDKFRYLEHFSHSQCLSLIDSKEGNDNG